MNKFICISGCTASGKSSFALELSKYFENPVIINTDALQVYDCWEILTDRPSVKIPKHLLYGHVSCSNEYSVGDWVTDVKEIFDFNSNKSKTFWANSNSIINITDKWRISYRARFDLLEQDLINHSFSVYRDLHCWELSLNWTPNGLGQGINFKINVKSPTLKDLKLEKKGGVYSGAGI